MKSLTKKIFFIGYFSSILILGSILCLIATPNQTNFSSNRNNINEQEKIKTSQSIERTIRVAIYNEPNTTLPSYAQGTTSGLTNKYSGLLSLLLAAGYHVSELTVVDISAHKLKTANYDVFIMADNLPRENITNFVKEFWLGGGGILSLDSAICFICYAGMIPPESVGSHGYGTYWNYDYSNTFNITFRNPVTKAYQVNDSIYESIKGWASFRWNVLQSTSIASEIIKLATIKNQPNYAPVIGLDPINKGGRIIQIPCIGEVIDSSMEDLIEDAVDWLCPRPKGRIIFDMTQNEYYGIDPWDDDTTYPNRYTIWRNNLVNRSYTVDKLYPSDGLTTSNLQSYDVLIINAPGATITTSVASLIANWVQNGGSLLTLGTPIFASWLDRAQRINVLNSPYGLSINTAVEGPPDIDYKFIHPTTEGCSEIDAGLIYAGLINYTADAEPIFGISPNNINVVGRDYGKGRVILTGDLTFLRNSSIGDDDNLQFGINIINWLTACQADVLVYVDEVPNSDDPNDNPYKGPVAIALNDLCMNFYLTFDLSYFNFSLAEKDWTLIVVESNFYSLSAAHYDDEILKYVKNGGKLIVRDFRMWDTEDSPLWQYLGFTPNGSRIWNDNSPLPPIINLWDTDHSIFRTPACYDADNLTTSLNSFNTDFCYVKLHSNATAIAGIGTTPHNERGAFILSNNGRIITNTVALTEYYDDTDDSTYPDALEIWENEIAFLMPSSGLGVPSGGDDDDGGDGGEGLNLFWIIILIGVIIGIIAIAAIVLVLKKKR